MANCRKIINKQCPKSNTVRVECTFTRQVGTKSQKESYTASRWFFNKNFNQENIEKGTTIDRAKGSSKDYALLLLKENVKHIEPIPIMPFDTLMKLKRENKIRGLTAVGYGKYSYDKSKNEGYVKKEATLLGDLIYFQRLVYSKYTPQRKQLKTCQEKRLQLHMETLVDHTL